MKMYIFIEGAYLSAEYSKPFNPTPIFIVIIILLLIVIVLLLVYLIKLKKENKLENGPGEEEDISLT